METMFTGEALMRNLAATGDAPSQRVTANTSVIRCLNTRHARSMEQVVVVSNGMGTIGNDEGKGPIVVVRDARERHW